MVILVTGATGTVGRCVVEQLVSAGAKVRALTRRPDSAAMPPSVEVVAGDLEKPESLTRVFAGVDRMYLLAAGATWQVLSRARQADVRQVVLLSSATAGFDGVGSDGDLGGQFHRRAEREVEGSGLEWTHLRPGMFASNLLDWAEAIRIEAVVKAPYDAARQSPVHELDIAAVATTALLSDGHQGKIYTLTGPEALTKTEQVAAIAGAIRRDIRFEELAPEQWREHVRDAMPPFVADWLLRLWAHTMTTPEPVLPTVQRILGRPPRTLATWAADHAAHFQAAP
ncbi:MAG: NAD(P)H-binding protein [Kutzneria sp.]|nr:NAD(P)H-binding protein [Kutzneria sp.]MBV9846769.1 NAD(P)H-binding protein [Kutzneria sp.]